MVEFALYLSSSNERVTPMRSAILNLFHFH